MALYNFLNGDYIRYYGNLFYDGYPYGLNHLDEYILRPILFFFQSDAPSQSSLYLMVRFLRLTYSLLALSLTALIVYNSTNIRRAMILPLVILGLSPLAITVSHFGTGDVGVDLFSALCIVFLFSFQSKTGSLLWLFLTGIAVGAAFSAKYNGLLIGLIPGTFLSLEFIHERDLKNFLKKISILAAGTLLGTVIFTPNFLVDPKTTLYNIIANFTFIKNYNVPKEILALPWFTRAFSGLRDNSIYIISSLGSAAVFTYFAGCIFITKEYLASIKYLDNHIIQKNRFLLSIAVFPVLSFLISLCGKYSVQPFHFSYLQIPITIVACIFLCRMYLSPNVVAKGIALSLTLLIIVEYGTVTLKENFFWRHEDNGYYAENLPSSIFEKEFFYTHRRLPIRSLFLESSGVSIFRNHSQFAEGLDAHFWNAIQVAPLPQVSGQLGDDWVFLNGPTFPKNERMLTVQGTNIGKTVERYLVLPADLSLAGIGLQSGSFATEVQVTVGGEKLGISLEAHQQKIISVSPQDYQFPLSKDAAVHFIPFSIHVPHDTVWVTFLTNKKEQLIYNLFGGGQNGPIAVPQEIPNDLKNLYFGAVNRIRFLDHELNWRVTEGTNVPMWEVAIPAGRYILSCEVEGLTESSRISIGFEDANGQRQPVDRHSLTIAKGMQRLEYSFSKPFAPFQGRFTLHSISGKFRLIRLKITPDYKALDNDFKNWRSKGIEPEWATRFKNELKQSHMR